MATCKQYDYVIVGGGTAGLVLAARLSELVDAQVLVLEAGEDQTADPRVTVPAMWTTLLGTTSDWALRTTAQDGLGGRELMCPQGRLLGGSGALNGLMFVPTSRANVDSWASLGNPGWEWASFAESMARAYTPPAAAAAGGPIRLSLPDEVTDGPWARAWAATLAGLGHAGRGDAFSGVVSGAVSAPDSVDPVTKQRSCSANTYLDAARRRGNLSVLTGATVRRVVFQTFADEAPLATGVEYERDGQVATALAAKEVILTAGALSSPRLLELSGVGGADRLARLGVDVVVDNAGVGENLQNHVMSGLSFEVRDEPGIETLDDLARQQPEAVAAATAAYARLAGPLAGSGTTEMAQLPFPGIETPEGRADLEALLATCLDETAGGFARAHADAVRSVLASPGEASACYISFPGFASFNGDGSMAPTPPAPAKFFTVALLLSHPLSRGSVHALPGSGSGSGSGSGPGPGPASAAGLAIDPRYLSHPLDVEILARHLRQLEPIAAAEPLASLLRPGGKRTPGAPASLADLEEAKDYVRRTAAGAAHFTGSCAMMPREMGGVVDSRLRVYGCRNLRVCDASIIPITPRANPQATVYGLAEHASQILLSDA